MEESERATDYQAICTNIADAYPSGIAHGVQKDAIQNCMDAMVGKGPVLIDLELVENDHGRLLTITDRNTTGLTGPVLDVQDYERSVPDDCNWARFESFAFTREDPDAIGARGQGKFIFLRASKSYTLYYDSLRRDGIYRVGATQATRTRCPILPPSDAEPWEDERGAAELRRRCGLSRLVEPGTRIAIVDPVDEVVEALQDGAFVKAIQETWFRAIEKQKAIITLCVNGTSQVVSLPQPYPLADRDSGKAKVWILGSDFDQHQLRIPTEEVYKVKSFHAVYLNKGTVPEEMRGIAVIHNGMKITSLPMTSAPPQVRERVTGFIEFDRALDRELRKGENQDPNHYDLKWRRRLPKAIRDYVNTQLEDFGKEKLGLKQDARAIRARRRQSAEEWAVRELLKHAKNLDLFGAEGGKKPPPSDAPRPRG